MIQGPYGPNSTKLLHRGPSQAASLGLVLNRAKCEISGHISDTRELIAAAGVSFRETETADLILLWSLPGVGVDKAISDKRSELETLSRRLQFMPAHDSLFLSPCRHCLHAASSLHATYSALHRQQ